MELLSLLFLLSTVCATETIQLNNQTFKLIPLGRVGTKFNAKSSSIKDFKLLSVRSNQDASSGAAEDKESNISDNSLTEDTFDCEVRIPMSGNGVADMEQLINLYNNQKLTCKVSYANGDKYEGEVLQKLRHGNGQMVYSNGEIYNGMWKNDAEHGIGKHCH